MAKPTTCGRCGTAHWSSEPCRKASAPVRTQAPRGEIITKPVRAHTDTDYPGRAELLATIERLKAENAKLKADAEATTERRTRNRDRMAARRAAGARP